MSKPNRKSSREHATCANGNRMPAAAQMPWALGRSRCRSRSRRRRRRQLRSRRGQSN